MIPQELSPALALETTQRAGGVALRTPDGDLLVERFADRRGRDDVVLPAIDRVMTRAGLVPADLALVGVSTGPGGFTGVRIGVTNARLIAEVTGAKLVAVPTAIAVAHTHEDEIAAAAEIIVVLAVKRGSFWATRLGRRHGVWVPLAPAGLVEADGLDLGAAAMLLADEHLPAETRARCDAAGVRVVDPRFEPEGVLAASAVMAERGDTVDPLHLQPLYPRRPEAVSLWERRRGVQ